MAAAALGGGALVRLFAFGPKVLPRRHVVLLVCDSLRADRLGCMGYTRLIDGVQGSLTPNIDALATGGTLFEAAFSQSDWTETSMASMLYSVWPVVTEPYHSLNYLPDPARTLTYCLDHSLLDGGPYVKLAAQSNTLLMKAPFTSPFEFIANQSGFPRVFKNKTLHPSPKQQYERADVLNRMALSELHHAGGDNILLYVHYMDTHETYVPLPEYRRHFPKGVNYNFGNLVKDVRENGGDPLVKKQIITLGDDYDASLMFLDKQIGDFLGELAERGIARDSMIILASDHGQSLGERNVVGHGHTLYPEETHVPLIIAGGGFPRGRVGARVRNIDIFPTIAERVGLAPRQSGISLRRLSDPPQAGGVAGHREVFSCMDYPPRHRGLKREMLITAEGCAYVVTTSSKGKLISEEVFNVNRDPGMLRPLEDDSVRQMAAEKLAKLMASARSRPAAPESPYYNNLNPVHLRQLRSLGYI